MPRRRSQVLGPGRAAALVACAAVCLGRGGAAAPLEEPPVFASVGGRLDLVIEAKPSTFALGGVSAHGWVYEVCRRVPATRQRCAGAPDAVQPYGGVRLALQPGDRLRVRLVNRLPPSANEDPMFHGNPTNLHTHGMIVEPRRKSRERPSWGDYAFVLAYNSDNGPIHSHPGMAMDVEHDAIEYEIDVPANHPSGLFWFHPHSHGLSQSQVASGLSGIITVGAVDDYARRAGSTPLPVRHLVLKDAQLDPATNAILADPDPEPDPHKPWLFTVNGQLRPDIPAAADGEVWRITNASPDVTYDLELASAAGTLPFQVVAIDGVSVSINGPTTPRALTRLFASKIDPVPCPRADASRDAVCARHVRLMPSSRVELWVTRSAAADATLRTRGGSTGPAGETWPAVELAAVHWRARGNGAPLVVRGQAAPLLDDGLLAAPPATAPLVLAARETSLPPSPPSGGDDDPCRPLPPGHRRRIIFGLPAKDSKQFGLGYQELDAAGRVVGGERARVLPFSDARLRVCLRLGPHNTPVDEQWELVNIAREDHNFHVHQTAFRVLGNGAAPRGRADTTVLHDNVPIPAGSDGCDGTVATWERNPRCRPGVVRVEIPFSQPGDFVYHCHILEHEDGGMMAKIRVLPFSP